MKRFFITVIIFLIFTGEANAAISENFAKTLEYMNIPESNIYGYEINEEIYNRYNIIVYGGPLNVKDKNQRWKDVSCGKWINENTGNKGEYRLLGYNVSGTLVNNELFPDDYVSGKTPEEWDYIVIEDALGSWNDTEKYQTQEQYNYMMNQKLMRNGIVYNLTAKDIGLEKARLEAYATWKTAGSIFTLKYDENGVLWGATFSVPPMAAEAKVNAILEFPNGMIYKTDESAEKVIIPFKYGAEVTNLSGFANDSDINSLYSELEVQYQVYDKISGSKISKIIKNNEIVINRADFNNANRIEIKVKNTSMLETCFDGDVPLVDIAEATLEIYFGEIEEFIAVKDINKTISGDIPKPRITSINLYRKSINAMDSKIDLYIAKKTGKRFICAGQVLVVEARITNAPSSVKFYIEGDSKIQTLDDLTKKFVYDDPRARGEKPAFSNLNQLRKQYNLPLSMEYADGVYRVEYIIPYETKQTIHSWNTLREISRNGLDIDEGRLFSRICNSYKIKIIAKNEGGTITKNVDLDVFERWDTVYNRDISRFVK